MVRSDRADELCDAGHDAFQDDPNYKKVSAVSIVKVRLALLLVVELSLTCALAVGHQPYAAHQQPLLDASLHALPSRELLAPHRQRYSPVLRALQRALPRFVSSLSF